MSSFGRLEKVDLRKYWQREDTHFTPWLADEENITLLGDAIGMELEVQEQEANVGPFRADILCKNVRDNSLVLIENQLERTDHTHLGQLLTYAAGLNAVALVWVVERFTEEHRAALDWLNRITDEEIHFFGLEIELWCIGDSKPAPKFNLAVKPNDWAKTMKEAVDASRHKNRPGQQLQVDYWTSFGEYLSNRKTSIKPPKPYPCNWMGYGMGRAGANLIVIVNKNEAIVSLETNNREHPAWFHLLRERKDEIEKELGYELSWEARPDLKYAFIRTRIEIDLADQSTWASIQEWMLREMESYRRVFGSRIKRLNDEDWRPEAE